MKDKQDKTSSNIQLFNYEGASVRTVLLNGEVWFVAKDVCDILGLDNPTEALRVLDDDEKNTLRISEGIQGRGNPNMNIISESGLYALIFRSSKPEAKKFSRWVRHEVLPAIRRTGSYSVSSNTNAESMRILADKKSTLRARRNFWSSIQKAYGEVEEILFKKASGGWYDMPDYTVEDKDDLQLLRYIFTSASTLMQYRINAIKHREFMLDKLWEL